MEIFNDDANIKQFKFVKFINENSNDDHLITKISLIFRRDKIEAPYYMNVKIKISTCLDKPESGIIHAMDMLNHNRMYNLTEDSYREIISIVDKSFDSEELIKKDKSLKIHLTSANNSHAMSIFEKYDKLFDKIDNLV